MVFQAVTMFFIGLCVAMNKISILKLSKAFLCSFLTLPTEEQNWNKPLLCVGTAVRQETQTSGELKSQASAEFNCQKLNGGNHL